MDAQVVHARMSVDCFNQVWGLLDQQDRSAEEDRLMREMAHASLFHWLRRVDCEPTNVSVGLWQVSRVHAVLGNGEQATRYAGECIEVSDGNALPPFYRGYGYEAAARAARCQGDSEKALEFLNRARVFAEQVEDAEEKKLLEADLDDLAGKL